MHYILAHQMVNGASAQTQLHERVEILQSCLVIISFVLFVWILSHYLGDSNSVM